LKLTRRPGPSDALAPFAALKLLQETESQFLKDNTKNGFMGYMYMPVLLNSRLSGAYDPYITSNNLERKAEEAAGRYDETGKNPDRPWFLNDNDYDKFYVK
jgi:hypothetical protein